MLHVQQADHNRCDGSLNSDGYWLTLEMLPVTIDGDGSVGSDGYWLTI